MSDSVGSAFTGSGAPPNAEFRAPASGESRSSVPPTAGSVAAASLATSSASANSSPAVVVLPPFYEAALLERQEAEMDAPLELSAAEIAALPFSSDEPPDLAETPWWLTEEFYGSDEAEQASWLATLPADIRAAYDNGPWDGTGEVFAAGFLHHDPGCGPAGPGFAAGGLFDTARPGPTLAAAAADASARRAELGESELIGLLCGWQRLTAWAQSGQADCLNNLIQRRKEQSVELNRPDLAAHVDDEAAAALALTGRAASRLLDVCVGLVRMPEVGATLAGGRIDWTKACLFTDMLAGLPDQDAADIAAVVLAAGDVTRKTTGQLRAALTRAILAYDPEAAQRRREAARKDASVQAWAEPSGNAALAGRELAPADVVHADAQLTADARWLADHGLPGSIDELRALAYTARLTGRPLQSLLPASASTAADDTAADLRAATSSSTAGSSSTSGGSSTVGAAARPRAAAARPRAARRPATATATRTAPRWAALSTSPCRCRPGAGCLRPLANYAGHGPADADSCRDLAARTGPATRWCLTLTGDQGQAVAHACASRPPGPPGTGYSGHPSDPLVRWAIELRPKMQYLETAPCGHARQTAAYRPPANLVHLIRTRQRTCSFPGCRRPARRCDLDHVIPYDRGGRTCECNLHPLCRRHHQAKQAPGWQLTQPQPGEMVWRLPSGRICATRPEPYPGLDSLSNRRSSKQEHSCDPLSD